MSVVEAEVGFAGVVVEGGEEDRREEGGGDWEGVRRRWRRRSVASDGVRTGRLRGHRRIPGSWDLSDDDEDWGF